jgi:K+-sensing histidine kinase KdpD
MTAKPASIDAGQRSLWLECTFAMVLVALAAGLRKLLEPAVGLSVPYVTFFLANALVIGFTGPVASVLAILLSTFAADWLFLEPRYTFLSSPAQYFTSALFLMANVVIMALAHAISPSS